MSAGPARRVGVFCGAKSGHRPGFLDCARDLGTALGSSGIDLVYGGSADGLMGELAGAVLRSGGHVIGVIPRHLTQHDPVKTDIDECHLVDTMHERKSIMYDLADSFVALPGGFGTLDELFEILTWRKIGLHRKSIVLLNMAGYFDPLLGMVEHAAREGFISPEDRLILSIVDTVAAAVAVVGKAGVAVGS
jgi:cytokinin riboside 5'-monophosphate phosphoribohydrolase